MNTFNQNRTYGVEIEFKGDRYAVRDYMNAHGVECHVEGYNHSTRPHWKIVTDASAEFELVSPPMKGEEGLRQLKIACEALAAAEVKVDKSCGLHVHHDVNDLDVKGFANIFALYIKLEDTIDGFMPQSRRADNNSYCHSLAMNDYVKNTKLARLKKAKSIQEIADYIYPSRYFKVNAQSYVKYGTIEFRHHSGTIEYDKITNWIMFTQRIVERAKEGKIQYVYRETNFKMLTLQKMLGIIACEGADETLQEVNKFYVNRAKHFSSVA